MPVPLPVTALETEARQAIIAIINSEFAAEGYVAEDDKLHSSLGYEGTRIGVYPEATAASSSNRDVAEAQIMVQFFSYWDKQVDNNQAVSPAIIETYAERFRRALQATGIPRPGTARVWYFDLTRTDFVNDPTGNKTRFVATIVARGQNSALRETAG